jgi:phosphatidylserine decarboxylase
MSRPTDKQVGEGDKIRQIVLFLPCLEPHMKTYQVFNRKTGAAENEISGNLSGLSFLYNTLPGRAVTGILNKKLISVLYGKYVKSRRSISKIPGFIEQYHIDISEVRNPVDSFGCLNDFFIRELKPVARPVDAEPAHLTAPADSRLLAFDLSVAHKLPVKGYWYSLNDLLDDERLAQEYADGWCLVFRLAPMDYHRYCYIDTGSQEPVRKIKGVLHSVNPIALYAVNALMAKNYRELTVMHTENFGKVLHLEVGAMMVGKVVLHHRENYHFIRGEEKGWFEFGGSTIIQIFKKGTIVPDQDILEHSEQFLETRVFLNERIGLKSNS